MSREASREVTIAFDRSGRLGRNRDEYMAIEDVRPVLPYQSPELNDHFSNVMRAFDREFEKSFGPLKTQDHLAARVCFATLVVHSLLDWAEAHPEPIASLETAQRLTGKDGRSIAVHVATTFDGSTPTLKMQHP